MDRETLRNLFLSKVEKGEKEDDCWIWKGPKTTWGGYLTLGLDGDKLAHRISYELFIGELKKGSVYKTCQNLMCKDCMNFMDPQNEVECPLSSCYGILKTPSV